jgi:hypothetical protein
MAQRYFPGENPIGKPIGLGVNGYAQRAGIVGIVGDVRHAQLDQPPGPDAYVCLLQAPPPPDVYLFALGERSDRADTSRPAAGRRSQSRSADIRCPDDGEPRQQRGLSRTL